MEYCPVIKKNGRLIHAATRLNLEDTVLSEGVWYERPHMVWVHVYEMCRIGKSREAKCRLMFAKGWGRGNGVSLFNRNRIYVCGNENIPYLDTNDDSILVNINILIDKHNYVNLCICAYIWSDVYIWSKEPACQCKKCRRREFDPRVGKVPWRRKWQPTPVPLPGESYGLRSLVGSQRVNHGWSGLTHTAHVEWWRRWTLEAVTCVALGNFT